MANQRNSPASFEAGEALEQYRRVLIAPAGTVKYADSGDYGFGVTQQKVASGYPVAVRDYMHGGTCRIEASSAITAGRLVYASNDGKVAATGTLIVGTAVQAASASGSILEVQPHPGLGLQSSLSSSSSSTSSSSSSSGGA